MSILQIKSFLNCGNTGALAKTDARAGSIFLAVSFDAEDLAFQAKIGDLVFFQECGLNFDHSIGSVFWVQHWDIVDIQKHQNTIDFEIEVGVGLGLCDFEREPEGVNIIVAKSWYLFESVQWFL